ncbi:type IV pilin protein [Caenimonas sedimenti]|nr:prepilin-type N-terminal cleavage/methylation domain-containing protein [Caenimonas sedimenti]
MQNVSLKGKKLQRGLTLIEMMIGLAIVGLILSAVLYYQTRAEYMQKSNQQATDLAQIASKVKAYYGPTNSYTALSASAINNMALINAPMKFDGTNVVDAFGNSMSINGTTRTFAITVGGATSPLDKEVCVSIASKLASNALVINVGNAAAAATGAVSGGSVYKASASATPNTTNLTTGCAESAPVIAAQFN